MKYSTRDLNRPAEELGTMTVLARRPQPVQRACPTAEVYDIEAILAPRRAQALSVAASKTAHRPSVLQTSVKRSESDPFLQRLSRLT